MNKIVPVAAAVALVLALVGCNKPGSTQIDTENAGGSAATVSDSTVPDAGAGEGSSANIGTPFTQVSNVQEAADLVGFGMDGPEDIAGYSLSAILAFTSDDPMIDMRYLKGDDEIALRKAKASDNASSDISGDYNEYAQTGTVASPADDGIEATTYGEDDLIYKMIWGHDGYVYSMTSTAGIDSDTAAQLLVQAY